MKTHLAISTASPIIVTINSLSTALIFSPSFPFPAFPSNTTSFARFRHFLIRARCAFARFESAADSIHLVLAASVELGKNRQ
jgi:hypothetical protein